MFSVALILFLAGMLTILLPCILPLIPVVLGVSIAGRSKWRPLFTVLGMLVSFVGFVFLLQVVLGRFVEVADYLHIGTYYALVLFGLGFLTHDRRIQVAGAVAGAFFFWDKGWASVAAAAVIGIIAMETGGRIASRLQQFGADVQTKARSEFGADTPVTAFIVGLTLGLVWVPCAGPALGFALAAVRERPGAEALFLLASYGAGTAVPLMLIGYGGQAAAQSVRRLNRFTGFIKQVAGVLLIFSGIAFQFNWFLSAETWLVLHTDYGMLGSDLEEKYFGNTLKNFSLFPSGAPPAASGTASSSSAMGDLPTLPKIIRAPEFAGLGPWHNSKPLTLKDLKGKVVLVDFWTYSCINCIRTLPYIQGYWDMFKDKPFVIVGVHTPEFVFEKSEANVADAIKRHGLTYPVAQDNDYGTWNAFANRYWPAKYLIDANGYIRYTHFGEGNYEETAKAIESLLKEAGAPASDVKMPKVDAPADQGYKDVSPETYLGPRSWPANGNGPVSPVSTVYEYKAPASMALNSYYLVGPWQLVDDEQQVLRGDEGEIRMRFLGGEMNLVLGLEKGVKPVKADIEIDGKKTKTITIDRHDLFNLFTGDYGEHDMVLKVHGSGVEAYAFTFGG